LCRRLAASDPKQGRMSRTRLDSLSVRCLSSYLIFFTHFLVTNCACRAAGRQRGLLFCAPFLLPLHEIGNSEELVRLNCPRLEALALHSRVLVALVILVFVGATVLGFDANARQPRSSNQKTASFFPARAATNNALQQRVFANLPLVFESNRG